MSGGGKVAIGGIGAVIILVIGLLTGKDFSGLLNNTQNISVEQRANNRPVKGNDSTAELVKVVLASTEDVWSAIFKENGEQYTSPILVMYTDATQSGCGGASSAMGPFYCPADQKVYIDLAFCSELRDRFQAPGNFAVAYVVAHEVGHHIQDLLGVSAKVQQQRSRLSEAAYNKLSVKLELQADFVAGGWAYHANKMRHILEPGDL